MQTDKTFTDKNLERAYQLAFFLFPNVDMALSLTITACELVSAIQRSQNRRARSKSHYGAKIPNEALLQYAVLLASEIVEMDEEKFRALIGSEYQLTRDDHVVRYIKYLIWRTSRMRSCYVAIGLGCLLYRYNPMAFFHLSFGCIDSKNIRRVKGRIVRWLKERFENTGIIEEGGGDVKVVPADSDDYDLVQQALRMFTPWGGDYSGLAPKETLLETLFDDESDLPDWIRTWAFIDPDQAGIEFLIREYNKLYPAKTLADPSHMLWIPAFEVQPSDDPTKRMKAPPLSDREKFLLRKIVEGNQIRQNIASDFDELYEELYLYLVGCDYQETSELYNPKISESLSNLVYEIVSEAVFTWTTFDSYAIGSWSNSVIEENSTPDGFIEEKNSNSKLIDLSPTGAVVDFPLTECKKPMLKPTLVIGLGGTGNQVVRRLKNLVHDYFSNTPSLLNFLVVDTDEDMFNNQKLAPLPALTELEQVRLYDPQVAFSGVYDNSGAYPESHDWLLLAVEAGLLDKQDRAGKNCMLGRVTFHKSFTFFKRRSNYLFDQWQKIHSQLDTLQCYDFNVETDMNVYLVSSLCGGQGAGAFIDATVTLRVLASSRPHLLNLIGVLPTSSVVAQMVCEEALKISDVAGDGTGTIVFLAESILRNAEMNYCNEDRFSFNNTDGGFDLKGVRRIRLSDCIALKNKLNYRIGTITKVSESKPKVNQHVRCEMKDRTIPTSDSRAIQQVAHPIFFALPNLLKVTSQPITPLGNLNDKGLSQPDRLSMTDQRWVLLTAAKGEERLPACLGSTLRGVFRTVAERRWQDGLVTARLPQQRAAIPNVANVDSWPIAKNNMLLWHAKLLMCFSSAETWIAQVIAGASTAQILVIDPSWSHEKDNGWQTQGLKSDDGESRHVMIQYGKNRDSMKIANDAHTLASHDAEAGCVIDILAQATMAMDQVLGGFAWVVSVCRNRVHEANFYLDDIEFDKVRMDGPCFRLSYECLAFKDEVDRALRNVNLCVIGSLAGGTGSVTWAMLALLGFFQEEDRDHYLDNTAMRGGWIGQSCLDDNGSGDFRSRFVGKTRKLTQRTIEHNSDIFTAFVGPAFLLALATEDALLPLVWILANDAIGAAFGVMLYKCSAIYPPCHRESPMLGKKVVQSECLLDCQINELKPEIVCHLDTRNAVLTYDKPLAFLAFPAQEMCDSPSWDFRSSDFGRSDYFVAPSLWPTRLKQFFREEIRTMKEPTDGSQNDCETINHTDISAQPASWLGRNSSKTQEFCHSRPSSQARLNPLPLGREGIEEIGYRMNSLALRIKKFLANPSYLRVRVDGKERMRFDPRDSGCRPFRISIDSLFIEVCGEDSQGDLVLAAFLVPGPDYLETGDQYEDSIITEARPSRSVHNLSDTFQSKENDWMPSTDYLEERESHSFGLRSKMTANLTLSGPENYSHLENVLISKRYKKEKTRRGLENLTRLESYCFAKLRSLL